MRKGQEAQQGTFEKAMEKGLLTDPSGKFTTMGEEWLKDLDPQAADRFKKVAGIQAEQTYQKNLKSYKALTPKQRAALEKPGSEAEKIEELGGPRDLQEDLAETQQAQPKPDLTPTTATPPPPTQPGGLRRGNRRPRRIGMGPGRRLSQRRREGQLGR